MSCAGLNDDEGGGKTAKQSLAGFHLTQCCGMRVLTLVCGAQKSKPLCQKKQRKRQNISSAFPSSHSGNSENASLSAI